MIKNVLSGILAKFDENQSPPLDPRPQSWGQGIAEKQGEPRKKRLGSPCFSEKPI
jgi:hypothetical protein